MNRHDLERFCTESLESAAKRYKTLGFSIIPLLGARNPQQPKLPAIKWARFQHAHPTPHDIQEWFAGQADAGIGIVCGRVSRLVVLDFDDVGVVSEFRHLHPDLVETYTVRSGTRGLPHLYFRLPEGMLVQTTSYPGVDLRGEGSYVVAPPTQVGDKAWVVESDAHIRVLSPLDLRRMLRFLAALKPRSIATRPDEGISDLKVQVSEFRHLDNLPDIVGLYRRLVCGGRNQALFKASVMARDAGMTEHETCVQLAVIHAHEPGAEDEGYESRYIEAIRTIASVYSRPRRLLNDSLPMGLSNAVRECLLQQKLSALARVLDGLYTTGMKPDQTFTEAQVCRLLAKYRIGRRSVMAALKVVVGTKSVFEARQSPLYPPVYANAADGSDDLNNSCEMSRGAKRVKSQSMGRPARLYRLPSPDEIAELCGVEAAGGDVIETKDFNNPRAYRQALHERLLERRPGSYPRAWLAQRLGVSRWTTRRYEKTADIQVEPVYADQPLSWALASTLPQDRSDSPYGVFLQTADGKRFPALRGLALRLMKQGKFPILKHQQVNRYTAKKAGVGIPTPQVSTPEWSHIHTSAEKLRPYDRPHNVPVGIPTPQYPVGDTRIAAFSASPSEVSKSLSVTHEVSMPLSGVGIPTPQIEPTFWLCPDCLDFHISIEPPKHCIRCDASPTWEIVSPIIWRNAQALKSWWKDCYQAHRERQHQSQLAKPVAATLSLNTTAEELAGKLKSRVNNLSLSNARNLVHQFGLQLVERALATMQSRSQIRSPAGFLISFLRSENKLYNNKNVTVMDKQPKGESASEWLRRLAQSEYLSFISNADEILKAADDEGFVLAQA